MNVISRTTQYLQRLMTHPVGELNRAQRFTRNAIDLTRYCGKQLQDDRAGEMAAALTYRTIFSLVPLVVLSMLAFRMFGDMDNAYGSLEGTVHSFFDYQVEGEKTEAAEFKAELDRQIKSISEKVSNLSFESIGAVGAILLVWAALGLLITVEQCANTIFKAPSGRPWPSRITIYWAVVTLGPLLLFVSMYVATQSLKATQDVALVGTFAGFVRRFSTMGSSWLGLLLLYKLMPNTHVRVKPAIIGALVAAVLWEISKWAFGLYVSRTVPYSKLYGTLGLIPLFLFWLYINWVIILFGFELTYTLQTMKGKRLQRLRQRSEAELDYGNPQWLIPIMTQVGRTFDKGKTIERQDLANALQLPVRAIAALTTSLEKQGLLLRVQNPNSDAIGLSLAKPPDRIPVQELIELVHRMTIGIDKQRRGPGWTYLDGLKQDAVEHAGDETLADLIARSEAEEMKEAANGGDDHDTASDEAGNADRESAAQAGNGSEGVADDTAGNGEPADAEDQADPKATPQNDADGLEDTPAPAKAPVA